MPKTRYFHPIDSATTRKHSQSTPALSTQLSEASISGLNHDIESNSSSRFPPVQSNGINNSNNSNVADTSISQLSATFRGNGNVSLQNTMSQRERDDQIIAEALAHATSYTSLDVERIQEAGFDPVDFGIAPSPDGDYNEYDESIGDKHVSDKTNEMNKNSGTDTRRQNELKKLVTYWAGEPPKIEEPEVREAQHRERVDILINNIRDKTSRRLQAPKWVKDKQQAAEAEALAANGGGDPDVDESEKMEILRRVKAKRTSEKDETYPKWVKHRMDFQNVFHRFAYRPRDLTKVALIAAKKHPEERLPQDKNVLLQWIAKNYPILTKDTGGNEECLQLIIHKIRVRNANANEIIYNSGEDANVFYLVFKGRVKLDFPGDIGNLGHQVVGPTEGFGEEALSVGALRPLVATAVEDGTILGTVRGFSFRETTTAYRQGQNLLAKRFLTDMVPLLAGWSTNRLLALAEMAERRRYLTGEKIGQQGKPVPGLAFLVSGTATIHKEVAYTKTNRWPTSINGDYKEVSRKTNVMVDICQLGVGDYFGEELLLGHKVWQGTVIADEPVEVLFIPRGEQLFTMFRRVAQKTLVHAQREHMQSEDMIAFKYLGKIHMNKTMERQKSLCYGVKHTMRLEEVGQAKQNEARQKKWERRMRKYVNKQRLAGAEEKKERERNIKEYLIKSKKKKILKGSKSVPIL
jgi:CRP-like cAMP-binding protein